MEDDNVFEHFCAKMKNLTQMADSKNSLNSIRVALF